MATLRSAGFRNRFEQFRLQNRVRMVSDSNKLAETWHAKRPTLAATFVRLQSDDWHARRQSTAALLVIVSVPWDILRSMKDLSSGA